MLKLLSDLHFFGCAKVTSQSWIWVELVSDRKGEGDVPQFTSLLIPYCNKLLARELMLSTL
jgi:hypothetical protein